MNTKTGGFQRQLTQLSVQLEPLANSSSVCFDEGSLLLQEGSSNKEEGRKEGKGERKEGREGGKEEGRKVKIIS